MTNEDLAQLEQAAQNILSGWSDEFVRGAKEAQEKNLAMVQIFLTSPDATLEGVIVDLIKLFDTSVQMLEQELQLRGIARASDEGHTQAG